MAAITLAAVFALAGLVSLHPALHVLWEHGGAGPAHVHGKPGLAGSPHSPHAHAGPIGNPHPHPSETQPESAGNAGSWVQHRLALQTFRHARSELGRTTDALRWLARIVLPERQAPNPANQESPSHHHAGFTQLLSDGGLDLPALAEPTAALPGPVCAQTAALPAPLSSARIYDPRVPRGPPTPNV